MKVCIKRVQNWITKLLRLCARSRFWRKGPKGGFAKVYEPACRERAGPAWGKGEPFTEEVKSPGGDHAPWPTHLGIRDPISTRLLSTDASFVHTVYLPCPGVYDQWGCFRNFCTFWVGILYQTRFMVFYLSLWLVFWFSEQVLSQKESFEFYKVHVIFIFIIFFIKLHAHNYTWLLAVFIWIN